MVAGPAAAQRGAAPQLSAPAAALLLFADSAELFDYSPAFGDY